MCVHVSACVTDMMLTLTTPTTVTSVEPFKPASLTPLNCFEKRPHFATVAATSGQESDNVQGNTYDGAIPIHINRIDPVSDIKSLCHVVQNFRGTRFHEFSKKIFLC